VCGNLESSTQLLVGAGAVGGLASAMSTDHRARWIKDEFVAAEVECVVTRESRRERGREGEREEARVGWGRGRRGGGRREGGRAGGGEGTANVAGGADS